jgi:hypothetical protein
VSGNIDTAKQKSKTFQKLIGIASVSVAKSDRGLLRFVDIETGRTVKEFMFILGDEQSYNVLTIGNKELLAVANGARHTSTEPLIVATSDCTAKVKAFLVIPNVHERISEDIPIIQAIVDQGQMLYRYLFYASA